MSGFDFSTAFVSVDSQESGSEFELLKDDGEPSGVFITIAGPNAKLRQKTREKISDFFLSGGEKATGATAKLTALYMDDAVAATLGWRFPDGAVNVPEFTPAAARTLYTEHPTIYVQVRRASDDLSRFTNG